jgi:hypothetical protein
LRQQQNKIALGAGTQGPQQHLVFQDHAHLQPADRARTDVFVCVPLPRAIAAMVLKRRASVNVGEKTAPRRALAADSVRRSARGQVRRQIVSP